MDIADVPTPKGMIEMDEAYVGGRSRNNRGTNQTMVMGAIQRSGAVRLRTDKVADRVTGREFIRRNIVAGEKTIYTDGARFYKNAVGGETYHGRASTTPKTNRSAALRTQTRLKACCRSSSGPTSAHTTTSAQSTRTRPSSSLSSGFNHQNSS